MYAKPLMKTGFRSQNELLYQLNILDSVHHGIIVTDLRGKIIYWNKASKQIFGFDKEEVIGKPVRILYGGETKYYKAFISNINNNFPQEFYLPSTSKNGEKIWLDVRISLLKDEAGVGHSIVISVCNIHKLKTKERLLTEHNILSETIIDTSADAIITACENSYILSFNRAATRMFGYTKKEITGKNIKKLLPLPYSEDFEIFMENYTVMDKQKIVGKGIEMHGLKKCGKTFPIELALSEVNWEGRQIYVSIIRDLTQRRELERKAFETGNEERKRIGRDLHDGLGQMLTGIRMVSENLARKLKEQNITAADEVLEISEMVKEADEFTRNLTRGMTQTDLAVQGLCEAIQNLCDRMEKLTAIRCEFTSAGDLDGLDQITSLHLFRITQEALNNATKHACASLIEVRLFRNEHHLSLTIDDDGEGFKPGPIQIQFRLRSAYYAAQSWNSGRIS
jgi:two-component system, LuxR family, sensor kinase FixL